MNQENTINENELELPAWLHVMRRLVMFLLIAGIIAMLSISVAAIRFIRTLPNLSPADDESLISVTQTKKNTIYIYTADEGYLIKIFDDNQLISESVIP